MSSEHGRQWWSTTPVVLRRYRYWQTFLGYNPATVAVAACLGENHRTSIFRKWSEFITMILNICKSDSLPGLYPSNASTSSGKVTAAYQRWCNTMYQQRTNSPSTENCCARPCCVQLCQGAVDMCAVLLTSTSDSSLGCTVLRCCLFWVVSSSHFWQSEFWHNVDSLTFFDTVCFKTAIWSCALHLADLGRIQ